MRLRHELLVPMQEIYICDYQSSPMQWHPFTAIPGKQPFTLRSIIKRSGSWTQSLLNRCRSGLRFSSVFPASVAGLLMGACGVQAVEGRGHGCEGGWPVWHGRRQA